MKSNIVEISIELKQQKNRNGKRNERKNQTKKVKKKKYGILEEIVNILKGNNEKQDISKRKERKGW